MMDWWGMHYPGLENAVVALLEQLVAALAGHCQPPDGYAAFAPRKLTGVRGIVLDALKVHKALYSGGLKLGKWAVVRFQTGTIWTSWVTGDESFIRFSNQYPVIDVLGLSPKLTGLRVNPNRVVVELKGLPDLTLEIES